MPLQLPARCMSHLVSTSRRVLTLPPTHIASTDLQWYYKSHLRQRSRAPRPTFHPRRNTSNKRRPHHATASVPRKPQPRTHFNAAPRYQAVRCHYRLLKHIRHIIIHDVTAFRTSAKARDDQPVRCHDRLLTHIQHTIIYHVTTWRLGATDHTDETHYYHIPDYTASKHGVTTNWWHTRHY
jgi:hypothetical protein